jgi:hypothetical protein
MFLAVFYHIDCNYEPKILDALKHGTKIRRHKEYVDLLEVI